MSAAVKCDHDGCMVRSPFTVWLHLTIPDRLSADALHLDFCGWEHLSDFAAKRAQRGIEQAIREAENLRQERIRKDLISNVVD